jgi:flagellar hook-length control protein FliK
MTPVSLAPVTPAVRQSDSHTDSARNADSDNFAALVGDAAGQQPDDQRFDPSVKSEASDASKHANRSTRAAESKQRADEASDTAAAEGSSPNAPATVRARHESRDSDAVPGQQRAADGDTTRPTVAEVAVVPVAAQVIRTVVATSTSCQKTAAPNETATNPETVTASIAAPTNVVSSAPIEAETDVIADDSGNVTLTGKVAVDHLDESRALKAGAGGISTASTSATEHTGGDAALAAALLSEAKRDATPALSRPNTIPATMKTPSWAAAAGALRAALQKSGFSTELAQGEKHAAQVSSPPSMAASPGQPQAGATALGTASSLSSRPIREAFNTAEAVHVRWGFAEAAAVALSAAIGSEARQQSAGSNADLGNGSSAYKAPLKQASVTPVFSVPAVFTRAIETTAVAATPALPPPFAPSNLSTVAPQIVKGLQLQVTAGGGDMRLTLTPEHLGTVSIEVRVEHDRVKATLMADTAAVRQWMATHQDDLRQSLSAAGLTLDDLVVKEDASRSQQERQDERPAPQKRRTPRVGSEEPAFEVVV